MELDTNQLTKELDRVKAKTFLHKNAAFLGSLLCSIKFEWNESIPTADINGTELRWNPNWFLSLPVATRETVLMHELWHVAKGHILRLDTRDKELWNEACDHHINLGLQQEGYTFEGTKPCLDPQFAGMAEEEIYTVLESQQKNKKKKPYSAWGVGGDNDDMQVPKQPQITELVNALSLAVKQAQLSGCGERTGNASDIIKAYLEPKIEWEAELYKFLKELENHRYSYRRPNRRYPNIYMPSRFKKDGKLEHLMYYLDCSGSVSNNMLLRFNSEIKYIKDTFNPKKLTLVMFDTKITHKEVILDNDQFDGAKIHGRGGTDFRPVREDIINEQPTAAIIFTDLESEPMRELPTDIPIIWIAVNARKHPVKVGKVIHIKE